jgi:hypothetical protein
MAAAVSLQPGSLDAARLSSFLEIEQTDVQTIIDAAADGLWTLLLQQVQAKAEQFNEINDAKALLEVNYGTLFPFCG